MAINEPTSLDDLHYGYWALVEARPSYERAAAMYEGSIDEVYSSPKIRRLLHKFGLDSIESMNFAHIPVDAVANKLRINAVTVEEQDEEGGEVATTSYRKPQPAPSGAEDNSTPGGSGTAPKAPTTADDLTQRAKKQNPVNSVIEDLYDYNEFPEELPLLFRNAGKYGDYYMMAWPVVGEEQDENESRAYDGQSTAQVLATGEPVVEDNHVEVPSKKTVVAVDMMMLDPMTTRVFYDVENPRKKKYALRSWVEGDGQGSVIRVNLYYPDRIERWMHKGRPPRRRGSKHKWEPYKADGKPALLPNPFDEVPLFHFRTDRTYGLPDHFNAYGPQLAINKLVTSHLAAMDYQSFPQRYALTDPLADQSGFQGADSDPFAPDDGEDVFPQDDDNESQLEADPGTLWHLTGMKEVGQFAAADADNYLKPFDRYVKALAQVTDTPFHYFDRTGERPPSGENIRQVNESLNAKAAARQTSYGSELRKATVFALNLLGHDVERVSVVWEPLENVTSLVEWQAINEKQTAGVPRPVTLVEAGYRKELVDEWEAEALAREAQEKAEALDAEERKIEASKDAKMEITKANQQFKSESAASKPSTTATKPTSSSKSSTQK